MTPPPADDAVRVLLVDDQTLLRRGYRLVLQAEPGITVVGEAGDGLTAFRQTEALHPDVVLMDIRMPIQDGITATTAITAATSARVLILTTFDLDEYVYNAIRAGASGFLLKDTPPDDLVQAILTVARGEAILAPTATRRLLDTFRPLLPAESQDQERQKVLARLTPRELDVLRELATGASNREIAAHLNLAESTTKYYVSLILTKLHLRDRVHAVVLAHRIGLQ